MTRRFWLAALAALPFTRAVKALDLVKVTVRNDGATRVWWEPRAMAEKRYADLLALSPKPSMPPEAFPWAVDREAHLARRTVVSRSAADPSTIDLHPLHVALDVFMRRQGDSLAIAEARHHLALVHAATAAPGLSFAWREMHEFCSILLAAPEWHPVS